MNKCKRRCSKDPKCYAFHYYLLDPFGVTNCWIWTKSGYSNNGENTAYCFVKNGGAIDDDDMPLKGDSTTDPSKLSVKLEKDRKIPDKSLADFDKKFDDMKKKDQKALSKKTDTDKKKDDDHLDGSKPCFTYRETKGCVMGKNMKKLRNVSFE